MAQCNLGFSALIKGENDLEITIVNKEALQSIYRTPKSVKKVKTY